MHFVKKLKSSFKNTIDPNQNIIQINIGKMDIESVDFTEYYDIKEIIGHGTSCTVRRAIRKDTGQQFAIKVYQNERLKAKNQIDMLLRVDHPNIVNIYDIHEDSETITIVLEYMTGGELYSFVGNKTSFSQWQVRQFMKAIIDAVRYCHQLGIVHRDIKPQNLLMTAKGPDATLKLADFGISKIVSQEMLNTNCGTPIYMAPEIWHQKSYNQKVDIWSIGVVMYYLLTGTHPFKGDNQQLISNIQNQELTFPQQVQNTISSKAIDLLKSILNKNPQQRPSAKQIANHLWFTHIETVDDQEGNREVHLVKAVHKIKRFIVKERLKKNTKMLNQILHKSKISKKRIRFLLMDDSSASTQQYTEMDQKQEQQQQLEQMEELVES